MMRSSLYEQALSQQGFQKEGVDFIYLPSLDLEAIDDQAGLRNQARLEEPVDEELISQYSSMDESGSEAPAIVVYKRKNRSRWVPIDGNQRIAVAKRRKKKTIDAYQVNCEDQRTLDRLTWVFNNLVNGKRLSSAECIEHAVTMVLKYGDDIKTAAKEWGLHQSTVSKRINVNKMRDILRSRGAGSTASMAEEKLHELHPFVKLGEDVFVESAKIVFKCGLTETDIHEMKCDVDRAKTHDDKVKAIIDFGDSPTAMHRRAETKGGTVRPKSYGLTPPEQMHLLLKKMDRLLNEFDKAALRRKGVGYKETHELAGTVADGLVQVFGLGTRLGGSGNGSTNAAAHPEKAEA